jgi:SAM-dependent methyltransferase
VVSQRAGARSFHRAHASPEALGDARLTFDAQADAFEARAGLPPSVCREVARGIVELCAIARGDLVVEIGPGTGQIGSELVELVPRYLGLDSSERMLAVFRARLAAPRAGVELLLGDASTRWPVADCDARCVFGSRSLHLLPGDHVAAEAARVTNGGGLLVVGRVRRERHSIREMLRAKLRELLAVGPVERGRAQTGQLLSECARRGASLLPAEVVACWQVACSVDEVLAGWAQKPDLVKLGLPADERHRVLSELRLWAASELGSAELSRASTERYVLEAARFA